MPRTIEKKVWPELFQKMVDGKKNFELRIADFDLEESDILLLKEWDPETKDYTGRELKRNVKSLVKFDPETLKKWWGDEKEVMKHGLFVIELGS